MGSIYSKLRTMAVPKDDLPDLYQMQFRLTGE